MFWGVEFVFANTLQSGSNWSAAVDGVGIMQCIGGCVWNHSLHFYPEPAKAAADMRCMLLLKLLSLTVVGSRHKQPRLGLTLSEIIVCSV
jgi:hypothetical protein